MYITKSLFVEYRKLPKLAWRKKHDPDVYKTIRKLETEEQEQHIMQIGMAVESAVVEFFEHKHGKKAIDLMPGLQAPEKIDADEPEDEDDFLLQAMFNPGLMMKNTIQAIKDQEAILYQPTFLIDNCLVRGDVMVRNEDGSYTLCEIKAKTSVRKTVTDDGEKKAIWEINKDLIDDMSFQKRVINRVLEQEWLAPISKVELRHLNKSYIKDGELSLNLLLSSQEADQQGTISIFQRNKQVEKVIDDTLLPSAEINQIVQQMKKTLVMSQEEFNKLSPRSGTKYLEYFGIPRTKMYGTVMWSGIHHSNASLIQDLYYEWTHKITELSDDEVDMFNTNGQRFISLYLEAKKKKWPVIDHAQIQKEFAGFQYPICFYDYESVSVPIPFMNKTFPYQQVVVQYSLHKLYKDGSMKHYGGLFVKEWEKKVEQIELPDHERKVWVESEKVVTGQYSDLLEEFLKDIGEDIDRSTFVVRHKGFENTRNKEIAELFPHLRDYLKINNATYDLRDIFSKLYYFDNWFKGSSSIKKVLPVLVPSMNYTDILDEVVNGWVAMLKLQEMIEDKIEDRDDMIIKLLRYCGLDSLAMVRIYEEVLRRYWGGFRNLLLLTQRTHILFLVFFNVFTQGSV